MIGRQCSKCGEVKALEQFNRYRRLGQWAPRGECKACAARLKREARAEAKRTAPVSAATVQRDIYYGLPIATPYSALEDLVRTRGACNGVPHIFGGDMRKERWKVSAARRTCEGCPVFDECRMFNDRLEAALCGKHDTQHDWLVGVWAGETGTERARRRLAEREAAA